MKVSVVSDRHNFFVKREIKRYLRPTNHQLVDLGSRTLAETTCEQSIHDITDALTSGEIDRGILITKTGEEAPLLTKQSSNVRAYLCLDAASIKDAVEDDVNLLVLAADVMTKRTMVETVLAFLDCQDLLLEYKHDTHTTGAESTCDGTTSCVGESVC